jgi:uncharacterized protein YlxP (DUF503 family)
MFTGICKISLHIHEVYSLKEKRHVIKSIIERLKSRFNVSAAEVGLNDIWQSGEIGVSCVSNDKVQVEKVINNILNFIENDVRVEIIDNVIDINSF